MASWTAYQQTIPLLDVTCSQISPGVTAVSPTSGATTISGSNITVTPGTIQTSRLSANYVADARIIEIISPVDNAASTNQFPDVEITFNIDTKNIQEQIVIDGSYYANMFPRKMVNRSGRQIVLGFSVRDVLLSAVRNPGSILNMPTLLTGLKYTESITVSIKSNAGFGNDGAVVTPFRIRVLGEKYTQDDLSGLATGYNGRLAIYQPPAQEFVATHVLAGLLSTSTWDSLSGGQNQIGPVKVLRRIAYAYNAVATNGFFAFTQKTNLNGNEANVSTNIHDLGDDFTQSKNAFLWLDFGLRIPSGQAYTGFTAGGSDIIPQPSQLGYSVSANTNDFQYGNLEPQVSSSVDYTSLHDVKNLAKVLVYGSALAPFINTTGFTNYAANTVSFAKSGILFEQK